MMLSKEQIQCYNCEYEKALGKLVESQQQEIEELKQKNKNYLEINIEQTNLLVDMSKALEQAREALELLHPMNPDEPCIIYEVWEKVNKALGGNEDEGF